MAKKKKKGNEKALISRYFRKVGRKGGKARLQTMTEEERQAYARKAAQARWAKRKQKPPESG